MEKEKWVQINKIQGFEEIKDCYWISNSDEDKIVNKVIQKQLKIRFDKYGYKRVNLITIDGEHRAYHLHTLKCKAFLFSPNPISYNVIRHLNDVKTDNTLSNLAWGTQSDNVKDCMRNGNFNYSAVAKNGKRTSKPIKCRETGKIYSSACEASRQLGIDRANISHCCNGSIKTAGGLHFEFVNKEEI